MLRNILIAKMERATGRISIHSTKINSFALVFESLQDLICLGRSFSAKINGHILNLAFNYGSMKIYKKRAEFDYISKDQITDNCHMTNVSAW